VAKLDHMNFYYLPSPLSTMKKILEQAQVAVIGTSGHASAELLKLLAAHPRVKISALATGNEQHVGKNIGDVRTELAGIVNCVCERLSPKEIADRCDVAITSTPADVSVQYVPGILDGRSKCIDLSGAYRLKDAEKFKQYYGTEHTDPENLEHAVYGLPELFRNKIKRATLVANPGCYATAAALAVAPGLQAEMIDTTLPVIVRAVSGYSGAGVKYQPATGIHAYKVTGHPHTPEIAQLCQHYLRVCDSPYADDDVPVSFTPRIDDDVARGIDADVSMYLSGDRWIENAIPDAYRSFYSSKPLVKWTDQVPDMNSVIGTNDARIFAWRDASLLRVITVIDNLRKGAASQAIQNLNLMCDFEETTGLD
jgi:N-acetyl-gamma-glutamyl-phosphate reductase